MPQGKFCTHYQLIKWAHIGMDLKIWETYSLTELEKRARERKILAKLHQILQNPFVFRPAPLRQKEPAPRIVLEAFLLSRGCKASIEECVNILKKCKNVKNPNEFIAENCSCRDGTASMSIAASTSLCALGARLCHHATANALDTIASVYKKRETIGAADYGDAIFKHSFVQCLLKSARKQVAEAIGKSSQWMICVRTYGRTGNPRYGKWPIRTGREAKGVLELTLAALERALGPTAHTKVLIFVSHEDQDFVDGRLSAALYGTPWENRLVIGVKGADLQTRFIEEAFPKGTSVVIADDNITDFIADHSLKEVRKLDDGKELGKLITRATADMQKKGASIWGLNASINPFQLSQFGEQVRRGCSDVVENVGLVYGAFFGIMTQRDVTCYTRWGQVGDDVERSIRYWQRDGIMLRYKLYGVQKSYQPGIWNSRKRGISGASGSAKKHIEEKSNALKGLIKEFEDPCCRLPRPGEASNVGRCGVVWLREGSARTMTKKRASESVSSAQKRARRKK